MFLRNYVNAFVMKIYINRTLNEFLLSSLLLYLKENNPLIVILVDRDYILWHPNYKVDEKLMNDIGAPYCSYGGC
jgi:hypothetical protein